MHKDKNIGATGGVSSGSLVRLAINGALGAKQSGVACSPRLRGFRPGWARRCRLLEGRAPTTSSADRFLLYLSGVGQGFWNEWKASEDDGFYWQKLNHIFNKHCFGFNKSNFVEIKFQYTKKYNFYLTWNSVEVSGCRVDVSVGSLSITSLQNMPGRESDRDGCQAGEPDLDKRV